MTRSSLHCPDEDHRQELPRTWPCLLLFIYSFHNSNYWLANRAIGRLETGPSLPRDEGNQLNVRGQGSLTSEVVQASGKQGLRGRAGKAKPRIASVRHENIEQSRIDMRLETGEFHDGTHTRRKAKHGLV